MLIRYTLRKGTQTKCRQLTITPTLTTTELIDLINAKNPGFNCTGWITLKPKSK